MENIVFSSQAFPLVPHEDENINHGVLGKSLAGWIVRTLEHTRFAIAEEVEEDFGYCLMIHRKPYWLWVGCSGASDHEYPENGLTEERATGFPLESIEWRVWVASEWGVFSWLLRRDNRKKEMQELHALLKERLADQCNAIFQ